MKQTVAKMLNQSKQLIGAKANNRGKIQDNVMIL
jgi:hypothetical protein